MLRHERTTKPKPVRNTGPHSLWAEARMASESERAIAAMVANTIIQKYTNRTDQRGEKTADFINEYVSYLEGQTIDAIQAFHQELLNKSVPENIKKSLVAQYLLKCTIKIKHLQTLTNSAERSRSIIVCHKKECYRMWS